MSEQDRQLTRLSKAGIGYLAADPNELARFMNQTGYDPDGLRGAIGTRALAMAVMDYFASNEKALLAMCEQEDFTVESFMHAWQRLNAHE